MGLLDSLADLINKFVPSRKGALVDQINTLTAQYQDALNSGNDTLAAQLRVQLIDLRQKAGLTNGDV